jgi:hypothetical protein
MITCPITSPKHQMGLRVRVALLAAGLLAVPALAVTLFVHPATARAFDGDYFNWCKDSLGQSPDVCCTGAGGELFNGSCVDPALLNPAVTAVPTVTQQVLPPVVVVPTP